MKAPKHHAAHFVVGLAVVSAGAGSTLAAAYQVSQLDLPESIRVYATGIAAILTASLALSPLFLAAPFGDTKTKTRWHILILTVMIMACDGALQMNAIGVAAKAMGAAHIDHLAVGIVIGLFQLSTFFLRGALNTATAEAQSEIQSNALAMAQESTRQQKLADKRRRSKAKKRRAGLRSIEGGRA